jgi:hypothetical protein
VVQGLGRQPDRRCSSLTGPVDSTWDEPGGALEPSVNFPDSAPDKVQPAGPAVNPYSLSTTGPATSCETTTGT